MSFLPLSAHPNWVDLCELGVPKHWPSPNASPNRGEQGSTFFGGVRVRRVEISQNLCFGSKFRNIKLSSSPHTHSAHLLDREALVESVESLEGVDKSRGPKSNGKHVHYTCMHMTIILIIVSTHSHVFAFFVRGRAQTTLNNKTHTHPRDEIFILRTSLYTKNSKPIENSNSLIPTHSRNSKLYRIAHTMNVWVIFDENGRNSNI